MMTMQQLSVLVFMIFLASCKEKDTVNPVVNMLYPLESATFSNGDTMWIQAKFSDNEGIHESGIVITKNGTVDFEHKDASGEHGHNYVISVTQPTEYHVKAEVDDLSGNHAEVERHYHVDP